MQGLQNSCVRYMLGLGRGDHISCQRVALGWLRIESRRHYFMGILMYKIMRMHNSDYLENLFFRYVPRFTTRGEIKELTASLMRTKTGINSFSVQWAHLWNSLPAEVRNLPSLSRFKTALRGHQTSFLHQTSYLRNGRLLYAKLLYVFPFSLYLFVYLFQ